jgi:hypothetical protein
MYLAFSGDQKSMVEVGRGGEEYLQSLERLCASALVFHSELSVLGEEVKMSEINLQNICLEVVHLELK